MTWTNILVPALGDENDWPMLSVARALAEPFSATITMVFAAMSTRSLFHWANEVGGGLSQGAIAGLEESTSAGLARCRNLLSALDYPKKALEATYADDWLGLRTASRLADVVVWDRSAIRSHGFFAPAFQQLLLGERRPALIAQRPPVVGGTAAIAWDGGREASRAVRRAMPLLRRADQVVLLTVPHAMARPCDGSRALSYLARHNVEAIPEALPAHGSAGPMILDAVHGVGARLLVAGAFGHSRLQRFISGGATQAMLEGRTTAALFLSH